MPAPIDNLPTVRDVRLDLLRGLANWAIFLDHTPNQILTWLTMRNYGFSDAADLFVFISGYTAALVFVRVMRERGYGAAASRAVKRIIQLYAAHLAVLVVYVGVIAWVSCVSGDPDDMSQFNIAAFTLDPLRAFGHALVLLYKPVNLDVLPLYMTLLAAFVPGMWLLTRSPFAVMVLSLGVYLLSRHFGWNLPSAHAGLWYFNPFTWQLLFFLGATVGSGGARSLAPILRSRFVLWLAVGSLIASFAIAVAADASILPVWIPNPFDPRHKTNLAPSRLMHFLALAIVFNNLLRPNSPLLRWRVLEPMIACGRRSLPVFCCGVLLSFCAHAVIELGAYSLWVQIAVGAAGILLMAALAHALDLRARGSAASSGFILAR